MSPIRSQGRVRQNKDEKTAKERAKARRRVFTCDTDRSLISTGFALEILPNGIEIVPYKKPQAPHLKELYMRPRSYLELVIEYVSKGDNYFCHNDVNLRLPKDYNFDKFIEDYKHFEKKLKQISGVDDDLALIDIIYGMIDCNERATLKSLSFMYPYNFILEILLTQRTFLLIHDCHLQGKFVLKSTEKLSPVWGDRIDANPCVRPQALNSKFIQLFVGRFIDEFYKFQKEYQANKNCPEWLKKDIEINKYRRIISKLIINLVMAITMVFENEDIAVKFLSSKKVANFRILIEKLNKFYENVECTKQSPGFCPAMIPEHNYRKSFHIEVDRLQLLLADMKKTFFSDEKIVPNN